MSKAGLTIHGRSLIEGLRREVEEETGITDFKIEKLLTVAESFVPETEGNILHTVNIIYHFYIMDS
ncbi:MAG: hypothetical protein QNJ64_01710 [Crocosphaera sp.]|nr:hypothetical protein [Crocosphaera sp.]